MLLPGGKTRLYSLRTTRDGEESVDSSDDAQQVAQRCLLLFWMYFSSRLTGRMPIDHDCAPL